MDACRRWARWSAVAIVVVAGGCRLMPRADRWRNEPGAEAVEAFVWIGGRVAKGGRYAMPRDGRLALRQALLLAGGAARSTDGEPDPLLVALRRADGIATRVAYLPLFTVEQGIAGGIPVRAGDEITIVHPRDTSLDANRARLAGPTGNGAPFAVVGRVADPGTRTIGDRIGSVKDARVLSRIGDILETVDADRSAEWMVLTRRPAGGLQWESFILPLQSDAARDLIPGDAPIVSGDTYAFGPIAVSPLLTTALIDPLVRAHLDE
ncbi:MAG: hypothetical protein FJ297_09645 [Planctomycetes bacterium]|nr:hypothetical protein [Planctomycetota bacterium]